MNAGKLTHRVVQAFPVPVDGVTSVARTSGSHNVLGDNMVEFLKHLRDETGQTMAEYAVVLGVITIAVVVTLGLLAGKISAVLGSVVSSM
jgi:Flp pilus assembly pilin Flp